MNWEVFWAYFVLGAAVTVISIVVWSLIESSKTAAHKRKLEMIRAERGISE